MKTLGIVGGIGPESTIQYYRTIFRIWQQDLGRSDAPAILIDSIDVGRLLAFVEANDRSGLLDYLMDAFRRLERAGADVALMAANTPHIVFGELQGRCEIPLVSIVDATRDRAMEMGLSALGILGTRYVMQSPMYRDVFARARMRVVAPSTPEQEYVHQRYVQELLRGIVLPQTRTELVDIIRRMTRRDRLDGVILAGTEFSLVLPERSVDNVSLLDTTQIHSAAAVNSMLAD